MAQTQDGHRIFTAANGAWEVCAVLSNGMLASYGPDRFASEATATLFALDCNRAKPFINYVVRRAA